MQVKEFGKAAARKRCRFLADAVHAIAVGAQSDRKGILETLDTLRRGADANPQAQRGLIILTDA